MPKTTWAPAARRIAISTRSVNAIRCRCTASACRSAAPAVSTAITSNIKLSAWGKYLGDATVTAETNVALENAILAKARQLRLNAIQ